MSKSRRRRRARNKIDGTSQPLIKPDPLLEAAANPAVEAVIEVHRTGTVRIARTLFSAELEEIIEIIARDRVYRAMMARLGRRSLLPPPRQGDDFSA